MDVVGRLRIRDSYNWHQRIWDAFARRDGERRDFLFRVDRRDEAFCVLVLSQSPAGRPDWCRENCFQTKQIRESYFGHDSYRFSLLANPTKKVNGKRIPLSTQESLMTWINRKADVGGFIVNADSLRMIPRPRELFQKNGFRGTHTAVEFQGILIVTDHEKFRATVSAGIGSAKAFGFGMLLFSPIYDL
jgi:CRISPR system Cascade subunit CasE